MQSPSIGMGVSVGAVCSTAPSGTKKTMKTASFGTSNQVLDDDEEEIITTSTKRNCATYEDARLPDTNSVMCGPAFDNFDFDMYSSTNAPKMSGPSKQGDELEKTMMSMLKELNIDSKKTDLVVEDDISKRMKDYVDSVESTPKPVAITSQPVVVEAKSASIGIGSDSPVNIPFAEWPEPHSEQKDQDETSEEKPYKDWDKEYDIDESDFRISSTILKWRDNTNAQTYANICKVYDQ